MKRIISFLLLTAAILCCFSACTKKGSVTTTSSVTKVDDISFTETTEQTNTVKIEMTDGSAILIELYPDIAPITVQNFKDLVAVKFYDGLIFHRVIEGFMIQGGDPTGTGYNGSGKTIKGEFSENGVENDLKHERGVISMARSEDYDSASSQFFICQADYEYGNGKYAAFGRVIAGMDTVDKIASVKTDSRNKPVSEQKISTIRFIVIDETSDSGSTDTVETR